MMARTLAQRALRTPGNQPAASEVPLPLGGGHSEAEPVGDQVTVVYAPLRCHGLAHEGKLAATTCARVSREPASLVCGDTADTAGPGTHSGSREERHS